MRQSPKKVIEGHFNKSNLNGKTENDDLTEQKKEITVDSIDSNNEQTMCTSEKMAEEAR